MAAHKGNLYALGNNGGRPPFFATPEELEQKIIDYYDWTEQYNEGKVTGLRVPTITGLTLYLGFCDRQALDEYAKREEEFSFIVKKAKESIAEYHECRLSGTTPTGSIFWLKNFGWKDTQQIDHTNNGNSFNSLSDAELVNRLSRVLEPRKEG